MLGLIFSCEHGGNSVPSSHRELFLGRAPLLAGHRGWDLGALGVAEALASHFEAPLLATRVTRLLIDTNRSLTNPEVFSEVSRELSIPERKEVVRRYYFPHRGGVRWAAASELVRRGGCLHVAVHSFTPELDGEQRNVDIGLLFDPSRPGEVDVAGRMHSTLKRRGLRVANNYPYLGVDDGLPTTLRNAFGSADYRGIELELNQLLVADGSSAALVEALIAAVTDALAGRVIAA